MNTFTLVHNRLAPLIGALCIILCLSNCAKNEVALESLSAKELKDKAAASLREKNYEQAGEQLELLVTKHPDDTNIARGRLSLANCYYKLEKYPAAQKIYEHYHQTYPADKYAEYAKYRSIQAQYSQVLSFDRDQTPTNDTIQRCCEYLYDLSNKKYRNEVDAIHTACIKKLIEKEIYVYNFYLNKGNLNAAKKRLEYLKTTYLNKDATLEPQVLYLEYQLAHKENKPEIMQQSLDGLTSKYPESPYFLMTQALASPPPFLF